ncbi:hypothetical protein MPH_04054 [Macrophomina phaseolina MS6]|uniref:Uncharacterized protein n=1 Tax=Macrophomina phaseolina (strain MS6) TaxID=1126212 RepID=K2RV83_MACPH|nr:hypothetical protein MPH_04054 [Macrophomina phaseolina MS6]
MFYTRKELATRMSIFYTGNMLASSFSGLIAAGIFSEMDGKHGLAGWQWCVPLAHPTYTTSLTPSSKALHHPGRHLHRRLNPRRLPPPRLAAQNALAHSHRAATRPQPHLHRYHRPPRIRHLGVEGLARSGHRLAHVAVLPDGQHASVGKRLQELPAVSRQDARLQHNHHAGAHVPAVHRRGHRVDPGVALVRPLQRAHVAHDRLQAHRHRGLRDRSRHAQHRGALCRDHAVCWRDVWREQHHPVVDGGDAGPDGREEGGGDCDGEYDGQPCVRVHAVPVAGFGRAAVLAGNVGEHWVFRGRHHLCVDHADGANEAESEDEGGRPGVHELLRVLRELADSVGGHVDGLRRWRGRWGVQCWSYEIS